MNLIFKMIVVFILFASGLIVGAILGLTEKPKSANEIVSVSFSDTAKLVEFAQPSVEIVETTEPTKSVEVVEEVLENETAPEVVETSVVSLFPETLLPKSHLDDSSEDDEEMMLCEAVSLEGVEEVCVYANYPVREKSDKQKRPNAIVSANDVYKWLSDPAFFDPQGLVNVEQRVIDAKKHLNSLFESGEYYRLLTPEQIVSIICRETCVDDAKALVNLTCLGDRGMVGYEKAHGPLQISQRAYHSVEAVKGLGLIGPDFHGDLALSELVFQAWVFEHCSGLPFEGMARSWNAGPSGYVDHGRAYGYFHGDSRRGVKQYLSDVVKKLPSVQGVADLESVQVTSADDKTKWHGPQGEVTEEEIKEIQFSKIVGKKFQLPSWDQSEEETTKIASNP